MADGYIKEIEKSASEICLFSNFVAKKVFRMLDSVFELVVESETANYQSKECFVLLAGKVSKMMFTWSPK